ncbi:hypothetical protein [Halobellus ruber]|uniref:Uncharacterized protein n=1 Tax=Halobellus ruber TaxID=2761102 RepID=A0A7J9SKC8_9EURY|nr:hypothetical protein [Halobellus ruber]MBB6647385.1 hypothetical protein [Halobellus ruber]
MAGFRRANRDTVNAFRINSEYLFKYYFEGDDVFARLRNHYNHTQYRFEVPVEEFEEINSFLEDHGYSLTPVSAVEEFVVVVRKYTEHPGNIFKQSVIQQSIPKYNCFLMTDQVAVDEAVSKTASAKPLTETGIDNPF